MNLPRHWRLQGERYRMIGEICHDCGEKLFPPRDVCPECHNGAPWSKNQESSKPKNSLKAEKDFSSTIDEALMEGNLVPTRRRPEG